MRTQRLCGRCGLPIKRGDDFLETVGIRFHWKCVHEAVEKAREEETAREQAQMQERVETSAKGGE